MSSRQIHHGSNACTAAAMLAPAASVNIPGVVQCNHQGWSLTFVVGIYLLDHMTQQPTSQVPGTTLHFAAGAGYCLIKFHP